MIAAAETIGEVRRYIRVIGIMMAAESYGLTPLPARDLHSIGFLADALAPVWGVSVLDADILKRREGPTSPVIQRDVDRLVGLGLLIPSAVRHVEDSEGLWQLDARYVIEMARAQPIIEAAQEFARFRRELAYLHEVVIAVSSLGHDSIVSASSQDATYSDKMVDIGGLVSIGRTGAAMNLSAQVALRFDELAPTDTAFTDAEKLHLYIRALHDRVTTAG
jgi:hypothetical protein